MEFQLTPLKAIDDNNAPAALTANQAWTASHERILVDWKKQIAICLYLQDSSMYYYQFIYNLVTIPNLIVGGVLSVSIFSAEDTTPWKVIIGVLAIFSTFLTSLNRQIGAAEKSQEHKITSRAFQCLLRNMNMTLALLPEQRPHSDYYLRHVKHEIDRISDSQLDPPLLVVRMFNKKYESLNDFVFRDIHTQLRDDTGPPLQCSIKPIKEFISPQVCIDIDDRTPEKIIKLSADFPGSHPVQTWSGMDRQRSNESDGTK